MIGIKPTNWKIKVNSALTPEEKRNEISALTICISKLFKNIHN